MHAVPGGLRQRPCIARAIAVEPDAIFTHPADKRTEDYITGRFG
jgi:ABC-type phosphate transport system ATPase subunit